MKIWVDDIRPAPSDCFHEWLWCRSTEGAKMAIEVAWENNQKIEIIDLDHDAGDWAYKGGDYINILNWLEEKQYNGYNIPPVHIHSMNPVGVQNMRAIIEKNGWKEVK